MQTLSQLEENVLRQPNSIELNQALAESYAKQGRWEEAAKTYRALTSLYPATAVLFASRLRLGALALMISSGLILLAEFMHPPIPAAVDPAQYALAISSTVFLTAQLIFLVSFALYSCSAISVYKLLSYTRDHRPAFWAMVLSVIGGGLSMSSFAIKSFVFPLVGKMYLDGEADVLAVPLAAEQPPWSVLLSFGGYLLLAGIAIFGWVVWRNRNLSLWAMLVFLAGWAGFVLSGNQLPKSGMILVGALIAIGGIGFGRSLWNRAAQQFEPGVDRSLP